MERIVRLVKKYKYELLIILFLLFISFTQISLIMEKNKSKKLFVIIFSLLGVFIFECFQIYKTKEKRIEKIYLKTILPLLFMFTLLLPPGFVPDEWSHYCSTISLSNQISGDTNGNVSMNYDEYRLIKDNGDNTNLSKFRGYIYDNISKPRNSDTVITEWGQEDLKKVFSYLPGIIGYKFASAFNFNVIVSIYTIRFFCMVFYVLLTYFALKFMPFNNLTLFTLLYFPVVIQQGMSLSYDSTINAAAFITVSLGLASIYNENFKWSIWKKLLCLFSALVLFTGKNGVYSFLLLIPIILQKEKWDWRRFRNRIPYIVAFLIILVVLNSSYVITSTFSKNHTKQLLTSIYPELPLKSQTSNFKYSLSYFIKNPLKLVYILIRDLIYNFGFYFHSGISSLGRLNINLSYALDYVWGIILFFTGYFNNKNERNIRFSNMNKLILLLIFFASSFLIRLSMLISWTPLGLKRISGVQGRYYIPILISIFMIFNSGKEYRYRIIVNKIMMYIIMLLSFVEVFDLFRVTF